MENVESICGAEQRGSNTALVATPSRFHEGTAMGASNYEDRRTPTNLPDAFPMSSELQVGQVLDERYKILDFINRGGMAWIYEALDCETGRSVALKVPLMRFESDPGFYSRFQREENIGLTLEHPYLLKMFPSGVDKSRPYIVMEYLEGQTLAARLRENRRLPENEAARIVSQICDGLDYLHRKGVVHRDLKPDNVMLCQDGTIRIMDFGIAKSDQARRLTFGGFSATMGTPDYIAPEQVQGKRGDARTDIYALGAMLYEMTTGFTPYDGDNPYVIMNARLTGDPEAPRTRNPGLSPEMEEIILHALERNPSKRFPSAGSMKEELNNYKQVALTERSQRLRPPQMWKTRVPLLPKIAALVVIQIVVFFLFFWWFSHRSHHGNSTGTNQPGVVEAKPTAK
jgi:serine/threonine-protein kinase